MDILHRKDTILYKLVFADVIKKCNSCKKKKKVSIAEGTGRLNIFFPWSKGELVPFLLLFSEIKT